MAVFALLTLLIVLAAFTLATRARAYVDRAECVVATSVLAYAVALIPLYALGAAQKLTATHLGVFAGSFALVIISLSILPGERTVFASRVGHGMAGVARVPWDALRLAGRSRDVAIVAVIATCVLFLWSALSAYAAPSWGGWDALWYHEPIVGFTIQNHGFGRVDLPDSIQRINGYPRLVEMVAVWCAIFADRRLVDLPNVLAVPAFVSSVYLLCVRTCGDRVHSLGWAGAVLFVPAALVQLHATYVDVTYATFLLAAATFVTRPRLRLVDAAMAHLALAFALGSKYHALVPVGVLTAILWLRILRANRRFRLLGTFASIGGGAGLLIAVAATVYWKNYVWFHNPFWPHIVTDRFDWPGFLDRGQGGGTGVDMNLPFTDVLKDIFSYPLAPAAGGEGSPAMNYGLVVPWLLLPAGALALIALPRAWLRGRPRSVERERAELALWLSFPAALVLVTSPALFAARYHLFVVGAAMALVSWFLGAHLRARRAATAFVAAATVFGLMTAFWGGGAIVTPDMMRRLLATPYPEREVRPDLGAPVQREVGLARETELHAGDIVTFYNTSVFVSLLWNNHYSNKVIYVPSVADYVERSEAMGATWLLCAPWDPCFAKLNQSDSGWEAIGQLDLHFPAQVFHRSKN